MHKFKHIVENSGVEKDGRILPSDNKYKGIKGFVSFYNFAYKIKYMVADKAKFRVKEETLGNIPLLKYLIENLGFSTMLWTYTPTFSSS
jgi:hypothetical protein